MVERAPKTALVGLEAHLEGIRQSLELAKIEDIVAALVRTAIMPVRKAPDLGDVVRRAGLDFGLSRAVRRLSAGERHGNPLKSKRLSVLPLVDLRSLLVTAPLPT
jgi:hypothetical protein